MSSVMDQAGQQILIRQTSIAYGLICQVSDVCHREPLEQHSLDQRHRRRECFVRRSRRSLQPGVSLYSRLAAAEFRSISGALDVAFHDNSSSATTAEIDHGCVASVSDASSLLVIHLPSQPGSSTWSMIDVQTIPFAGSSGRPGSPRTPSTARTVGPIGPLVAADDDDRRSAVARECRHRRCPPQGAGPGGRGSLRSAWSRTRAS